MIPINQLIQGDFLGFILRILFLLPALVVALSFHEAAHAWAANKMGDPTAKNLGRLTLDPTKHFDWFGLIAFLFIGFGWGKPVPTNPRNYRNYKKGNVLVALSGVTANLIIALFFLILLSILAATGVFESILPVYLYGGTSLTFVEIIHTILFFLVYLNLILFIFNLIPIPPLDGHHLVKGFIARKSPQFYMFYQRYGFLLLILLLFAIPWLRNALVDAVFYIIQGVSLLFGAPFYPMP